MNNFLAFDLGASSGRAILGTLKTDKISLNEVHRFENSMLHIHGNCYLEHFQSYLKR